MIKLSLHQQYRAKNTATYAQELLSRGNLASGGEFSQRVKEWFAKNYSSTKIYLNPSCTAALEMSCLISNLERDDEIIVPSYTYVSTANAFAGRGLKIKFADCEILRPNVSLDTILPIVTKKTRVVVVMHYAGIAVEMDPIIDFCKQNSILLIEDAAHAMGSSYKKRSLGTLGDMGTLSFHSTKICSCGEGGNLILNNPNLIELADQVFEKGTNKKEFEVKALERYEWVSLGSSFSMSEIQAAVLFGQLDEFEVVLNHRRYVWDKYMNYFAPFENSGDFLRPDVPDAAEVNGSHFYIILENKSIRDKLSQYLNSSGIEAAFHYLSLHKSPFMGNPDQQHLVNSDNFEERLLRLPIHMGVQEQHIEEISKLLKEFFGIKVNNHKYSN